MSLSLGRSSLWNFYSGSIASILRCSRSRPVWQRSRGSQGVAADAANQLVLRILTQGKLNAAVYSAVGAESILQEDLDKAVVNLQQALALAPNDPVVLNNLAIALVRRSKDNAGQALQLAQQALSIVPGHLELLADSRGNSSGSEPSVGSQTRPVCCAGRESDARTRSAFAG